MPALIKHTWQVLFDLIKYDKFSFTQLILLSEQSDKMDLYSIAGLSRPGALKVFHQKIEMFLFSLNSIGDSNKCANCEAFT